MSKFISSFTESVKPKPSMKLHFNTLTHQWSFHLLPTIDIYLETHSPKSFANGFVGLYLSLTWFKWSVITGIYRSIK